MRRLPTRKDEASDYVFPLKLYPTSKNTVLNSRRFPRNESAGPR